VALMALWALSGFCLLTLETAWIRESTLRVGNTAVASALVISAFFASAALGNLAGARLVAGRKDLLSLYGRIEIAAALAAAATFALNRWLWARCLTPDSPAAGNLLAVFLLVGPPSFLAGASFPCLAEAFVEDADHRTATGGRFYGMNLLGAALGIAAGGLWLPLTAGLFHTVSIAAALQLAGGALAWRLAARARKAAGVREGAAPCASKAGPPAYPSVVGWALLAASGALSLAVQSLLLVWVRQVLEGSAYAVCGTLAVFLGGLGAGSLAAAALRRRGLPALDLLLLFAAASALLLFALPSVGTRLCACGASLTAGTPSGLLAQSLLGCGAVLLPLTICLGGVFPVAWELVSARAASEGRTLGLALCANKLGAAAGASLGLFALLPLLGLSHGTLALGWSYWALACATPLPARQLAKRHALALCAVAAFGLSQGHAPARPLGLAKDERPLACYSGPYGPVTVVESQATGSRHILLNSRQRLSGTAGALASQRHQSWVPLLFCRTPARVATIGMAAGLSAAAALDYPLRELHAIELVPEVVAAAREHFGAWNTQLFSDPRAHVHVADGRVRLARLGGSFDAIICDLLFPSEDGTAYLYSRDFFAECRSRLSPGGVFCLWLPCYQLTPQTAGIVIRTFAQTFPNAILVRANLDPLQPVLGLLGANDPIPMSGGFLSERVKAFSEQSPFFRSAETARLLFVADLRTASPDFGAAPTTTDDRPAFAYYGPCQPQGTERLYGFPLLKWIGARALKPDYPSCDLGDLPCEQALAALRAGNYLYAAAAARLSLPGDPRAPDERLRQVSDYSRRALSLWPASAALCDH
jgi:spermidine synthase